jgi:hypothetical protein
VQELLKEMEDLFTTRFGETIFEDDVCLLIMSHTAKGDRKNALVYLRAVSSHKTHHSSTFRAGLALGLAFPALIDGIVRCKFLNVLECSFAQILQVSSNKRDLLYHHGKTFCISMGSSRFPAFLRSLWAQIS